MELPTDRRMETRVWNFPTYPSCDSSTDSGYFSVGGSSDQSEHSYPDSDTMSELSDRSKDSGPYFKEEPFTSSIKKIIETALKEHVSSSVQVVAFAIVVAAVLYITCSGFSREKLIKQDVKIILPASSEEDKSAGVTEALLNQIIKELKQGTKTRAHEEIQAEKDPEESSNNADEMLIKRAVEIALKRSSGEDKNAVVMEKLLNHIIKELKQEVQSRVRAEIKAERDTKEAPDSAKGDGFIVSVIKWPFVVIVSVIKWLFAVIVSVVKLPFEILLPVIWLLFDIFVPVLKLFFLMACVGFVLKIYDEN